MKKLKYKIPKEIKILSQTFKVIKDNKTVGATFSCSESEIVLGTALHKKCPDDTFMVLVHEISEIIHCITCTRYDDYSTQDNYKFFMDHKEFENHNNILTSIIYNQLLN